LTARDPSASLWLANKDARSIAESCLIDVYIVRRPHSLLTYPYLAPHTAKIHTLITLGISSRTKPLVLKARKRPPCGFDSHRPLHSQATPGHAGLQDWGQDIDPMGKSWESMLRGRRSHGLTYPRIAPRFTRTVTRSSSQNELCDSHVSLVAKAIAGGWTRPLAASDDRRLCATRTLHELRGFQYQHYSHND
jgi:hypothetical protein